MGYRKTAEIYRHILPELKAWMERVDMPKWEVADIAGCSRPHFTRMLMGQVRMQAKHAARLSSVSGIPIERLMADKETARMLKLLAARHKRDTTKLSDKLRVAEEAV